MSITFYITFFGFSLTSVAAIAVSTETIVLNPTASVPKGVYIATPELEASYVTFCLNSIHRTAKFYTHYCSPDNPDGLKILKRIQSRENRAYTVVGDHPASIDSRLIGPITSAQIKGFYKPLFINKGSV